MDRFNPPVKGDASGLVVAFTPESDIVIDERGRIISRKGKDRSANKVNELLKKYDAVIGAIGSKITGIEPLTNQNQIKFYTVRGAGVLEEFRQKLILIDIVDAAYFKPVDEDPGMLEDNGG